MSLGEAAIPVIESVKEVGPRYVAWLTDVWGVMHDGVRAYSHAVAACRAFRAQGGLVLLLSNSPRPTPAMVDQLGRLGVPADAYDATVTSGDLTRALLAQMAGARVFHLGPDRDRPIFDGLDVNLVGADEAELVLCSGLFDDETETPEDYRELLRDLASRNLLMICANPDHKVQRGSALIYCAGALAALYAELGGRVVYAGKPHRPIYELALARLSELARRPVAPQEVLAIGDGVHTDMEGAAQFGIDSLFVASGLHSSQGSSAHLPKDTELQRLFAGRKHPLAVMPRLAW